MTEDPSNRVPARLRFIERMRKRLAGTAEALAADLQGSGPANRHGAPRMPIGQHPVNTWPVLDLGDTPEVSLDEWRLEIGGLVEQPVVLDWAAFMALPQVETESDFHCVTTWSLMDSLWGGVLFADLAALVRPTDEARFVYCTGYDHMPGSDIPYTTNLPLERAIDPDVMLVHTRNGEPLPIEHGGPCRMITPRLYAWKGAKWIRRIEFLAADQRGFWELRGYSNTAEPWAGDRLSPPPSY